MVNFYRLRGYQMVNMAFHLPQAGNFFPVAGKFFRPLSQHPYTCARRCTR